MADLFPEPYLDIGDLKDTSSRKFRDGIIIPFSPFPGTIGIAPPEDGQFSIVPPYFQGGNMDCRHLTAGSKLWLPVCNEGALLSLGDTHAAQGDGEVCGTAVEEAMTVALRVSFMKGRTISAPHYHTQANVAQDFMSRGYHGTMGIDSDLKVAARKAVSHMIEHLGHRYGLRDEEAYALCSLAVDLRITEIVDAPHWTVSAVLPNAIFMS